MSHLKRDSHIMRMFAGQQSVQPNVSSKSVIFIVLFVLLRQEQEQGATAMTQH